MGFKCGIVGLPNVGKSTLFNALTQTATAEAANYPFCTIEPNVGEVAVPDERLDKLAAIARSAQIIPTQLTFVDIAGLVRGASKGEGLGNQFLSHIREVDAIAHVLRCFEDDDITHVEGRIDPLRRRRDGRDRADARRPRKPGEARRLGEQRAPRAATRKQGAASRHGDGARACCASGKPARAADRRRPRSAPMLRGLQLPDRQAGALRLQRRRSVGRQRQRAIRRRSRSAPGAEGAVAVVISAEIEAEIAGLPAADATSSWPSMGLEEPGLNRLIRAGYELLDLLTYFTVGPKEARAWTDHARHQGAAGRGRHPHRLRERLHPRRDHRLRRLRRARRRARRQGRRARCGSRARNTSSRTAT